MRYVTAFLLLPFIALFLFTGAKAQSGACTGMGTYINYHDYINYSSSAGGDFELAADGYLEIGPAGLYDIYGALINNGHVEVQNGGVLNIWGDVINNTNIIVHAGATINFYGKTWTNASGASVTDGAPVNTVPGGDLSFIAGRPAVPADWLGASTCLLAYSGGNALQNIDGGNIPMDIQLRLGNANNVVMINSATRIEGKLQWDSAGADIELGNQDLVMTQNATQDGFREDRFAITNGTGHVVKENYTGEWIFPVGITDGDYTPAAIYDSTANTMHVLVQDYTVSASDEDISSTAGDGMNRTWNIYADLATGNAVINLQHNSTTNQPAFNDAFNFVTRWGSTAPNTTGDYIVYFTSSAWQTNNGAAGATGNLSSTGTVSGASMRSRTYTNFATAPGDYIAYFTKSSDPYHPLPVQLVSFSATAKNCDVLLEFKTGIEASVNKFQVQHSADGITYATIAEISPKGNNSYYSFVHTGAPNGRNLYRIVMLEPSGDYTYSGVLRAHISCEKVTPKLELYPNPARDFITVSGMTGPTEIRIMNELGRLVSATSSIANKEIIDISQLPVATYVLSVFADGHALVHIKLIKQ
jgi:hypothetical protein